MDPDPPPPPPPPEDALSLPPSAPPFRFDDLFDRIFDGLAVRGILEPPPPVRTVELIRSRWSRSIPLVPVADPPVGSAAALVPVVAAVAGVLTVEDVVAGGGRRPEEDRCNVVE